MSHLERGKAEVVQNDSSWLIPRIKDGFVTGVIDALTAEQEEEDGTSKSLRLIGVVLTVKRNYGGDEEMKLLFQPEDALIFAQALASEVKASGHYDSTPAALLEQVLEEMLKEAESDERNDGSTDQSVRDGAPSGS